MGGGEGRWKGKAEGAPSTLKSYPLAPGALRLRFMGADGASPRPQRHHGQWEGPLSPWPRCRPLASPLVLSCGAFQHRTGFAVAKPRRLGALNSRNVFSTAGGWKSKIKVWEGHPPSETCQAPPGFWWFRHPRLPRLIDETPQSLPPPSLGCVLWGSPCVLFSSYKNTSPCI